MTPEQQHEQVNEWARASLLLADTRADRRDGCRRHVVVPLRTMPPVVVVARPGHVFVIPHVEERKL